VIDPFFLLKSRGDAQGGQWPRPVEIVMLSKTVIGIEEICRYPEQKTRAFVSLYDAEPD
jgi:hypothetical protein